MCNALRDFVHFVSVENLTTRKRRSSEIVLIFYILRFDFIVVDLVAVLLEFE